MPRRLGRTQLHSPRIYNAIMHTGRSPGGH